MRCRNHKAVRGSEPPPYPGVLPFIIEVLNLFPAKNRTGIGESVAVKISALAAAKCLVNFALEWGADVLGSFGKGKSMVQQLSTNGRRDGKERMRQATVAGHPSPDLPSGLSEVRSLPPT